MADYFDYDAKYLSYQIHVVSEKCNICHLNVTEWK